GGTVSVTLTGSDEDGDALSFTVLSQPKNGTLTGTAPALTYSPKADYSGSDSFKYKVNDGEADSNVGTVSIEVKPEVELTIEADYFYTDSGISISFSGARGNAHDVIGIYKKGSSVDDEYPIVSLYVGGELKPTDPLKQGVVTFENGLPNAGSYFAVYFHNEDNDASNEDYDVLDVFPFVVIVKNIAPAVVDRSVEVYEGGTVSVTLTGSDEDGDALSFAVLSQPKNGTLTGTAPALTYSPKADYSGIDSFSYKANDGSADSNVGTVTITVNGVNDKPEVANQSVDVNEDGSVSITLSGSDEEGDTLSFTILSQPKNGTLSGTAPSLSYSPYANYSGSDSFSYKANDGSADSNTATVTISVASVNDKPVVAGQSVNVDEDGSVSITLTGSDEDGDGLSFTVLSQPKNGTLRGTAPALSYSPKANYSGSDSFTFKANDGSGDSKTATIMISVIKQGADKVELTLSKAAYEEGEQIEISYSGRPGNAQDWVGIYKEGQKPGDYDSVQYQFLDGKTSGELIFDPLPSGKYEVHLFADDSYQKLYTAHFDVREAGSPLVTTSKGIYNFGETINISYAAGPGNQKDWIGLHEEGKRGTWPTVKHEQLQGKKSGTLEWDVTLEKGKKYNIALYKDWSLTVIATAEFSISTKNIAAPVARSQKLNARTGKAYRVKLEGSDTDGDAITYRIVAQPKHGTLNGTAPNLIYTSNTDYAGSDSFTYVANDGELDSIIATVDFDINNNKPKKWTILVYNQGDSNLAKYHLKQSKEFQRLGSNNNVNVIIQSDYNKNEPGFTKGFVSQYDDDYDNISNGVTRIVIGENEQTHQDYRDLPRTTPVVERLPEGSRSENRMDDPQVFGEFLDWGMLNYPAERYALLLFDHGGGFYGFGGDDQDGLGGANALKPRAFRSEIQSSLEKAGVEKFDFINFFACLMGASEVLDAFDGLCDVFFGNPEIAWYYHIRGRLKYIETLLNDPDIDNITLAKNEVLNWLPGGFYTDNAIGMHCAYDMSKYGAYKIAFNKFSIDLLAELKNKNPIISASRRNTTPYWKGKIDELKEPSTIIDLAHFSEILSNNIDGTLKSSSAALVKAIDAMIIGKHVGSKRPDVAGLSIYYPINGLSEGWSSWDSTYFAKGTGGDWSRYLRQVNSLSDSETGQTEFVLNSEGELVARSAGFGLAESGLMSASETRPVSIEFELESAENAYDYFINLVSNRETDDPNQFIYLGELHRDLIDGKKKHQYNWDTRLPVLSLEVGGAKAPPVGTIGVDRKELVGEMPLYLGGWWSELSDDLMVSYADYQGPGEEEKTHLILMTKYLEGGAGILESIILDSSLEDAPPDGAGENKNQVAPVGVDFEFEPGAKLWPVYYMEEPDPEKPSDWKPYFTWFKDGYIKIPENGKDGLVINWVGVEPGDYRAEVQVSDFYGNLSEELKFDIRVEGDIQGLPSLMLTLEGARVVLSWGMEDGGDEAILQWVDGLGGEWVDVPSGDLGFGGAGRLYKENANGETKFYRLIKR
ncbi:Ig-like domain-containing protein, partial [bacterium]|nr:Ig-like domain-containing protein [bacterium]